MTILRYLLTAVGLIVVVGIGWTLVESKPTGNRILLAILLLFGIAQMIKHAKD